MASNHAQNVNNSALNPNLSVPLRFAGFLAPESNFPSNRLLFKPIASDSIDQMIDSGLKPLTSTHAYKFKAKDGQQRQRLLISLTADEVVKLDPSESENHRIYVSELKSRVQRIITRMCWKTRAYVRNDATVRSQFISKHLHLFSEFSNILVHMVRQTDPTMPSSSFAGDKFGAAFGEFLEITFNEKDTNTSGEKFAYFSDE